jgi:hypothetical protein
VLEENEAMSRGVCQRGGCQKLVYEEVEEFVAHHKCHRNVFDQEKKWIKQELNKNGIDVGH